MRGIVLTAGGRVYFINAYTNCVLLREMGCNLPIEWNYLGDEMKPAWLKKVEEIPNVRLVNLGGDNKDHTKDRGGWQSKIDSILGSKFDEILFLDADCFPLRDPSYLFDHPFYKETGAVLWPDISCWSREGMNFLSKKYNVNLPTRQVESGQMMFNPSKCKDGLHCVKKLNVEYDNTYKVVYGDKDTFLIGMLQGNSPFRVVPHLEMGMHGGLRHADFDGKPLFCHLTGAKFQKHGRPFVKPREFPNALKAMKIIKSLQPIL